MPRQKLGPAVYSTKAFLFIQKSTIGFIPQILKKGGGGQGFPSQCPYANSLATPGVALEEGCVGHMLPMRWGWKPRAWVRFWPPSSNPHLQPPSQTIYLAEQDPQMSLLLITTRGRSQHSLQYLEAETTGNRVAFT